MHASTYMYIVIESFFDKSYCFWTLNRCRLTG